MKTVVGIYNADSGIIGNLSYLANKVLRRGNYSPFDLTHGWTPNRRRSWKEACVSTCLEVSLVHLNEATSAQLAAAELLPAIVAVKDGGWVCRVTTAELAEHSADPDWVIRQMRFL